jgi:hypothetical protein
MDDPTIEMPLPAGTRPDPDNVITQEIPVVARTLEMPVVSLRVVTAPTHLLGDPIFTMGAPRSDETPLFDQLYGRPEPKPVRRRRKMPMADKVLICMGVAVVFGGLFIYGMVTQGWGAGEFPDDPAAVSAPRRTSSAPEPVQESTRAPAPSHTPVQRHRTPSQVPTPHTHRPRPTRSVEIITPPEPTPTPTPVTAGPTESPSPTPTPTESPSASPSLSLSTSPSITPTRSPS